MLPKEKLADFIPCTLETTHIDLLIGSDYFWDMVGGDKIVLPSGMFMIPSGLGYIITGKCPEIASVHQDGNLGTLFTATRLHHVDDYQSLHCSVNVSSVKNPDLETFWSLELVGIADNIDREGDDEALEKLCKTVKFVDESVNSIEVYYKGVDSVDDTHGIYEEAKHIFKKAAMNLREWNSNCSEFLECLPNGERSITSGITKVLGLFWDPVGDTLSVPGFNKVPANTITTKRDVIHSVARIFDPLGFLSPITIHGKLLLQKTVGS
ncbi:uncharacterized protein [Dysidea avara]|uniref:uncharacterized protein n=1 Tax=Dysidea avara TaxID=196820 RepID=UPI003316897B